jgi:hypothetical protein
LVAAAVPLALLASWLRLSTLLWAADALGADRGLRLFHAGLLALPLLLLAGAVWAGSSDGTAVDWQVLSGGGAPADAGSGSASITLNGTLGQTAIGLSSDGRLGAGFWYGVGKAGYQIYLPLVIRNS